MTPYYDDGCVTIYLGRAEEVLPSLPAGSASLAFTSPPYNLGVSTGGSFPSGKAYGKWTGGRLAAGYDEHRDAMPWEEYVPWQQFVLGETWRVLDDKGAIFYNHKPRVQAGVMLSPLSFIPPELPVRQIIIWAKAGGINSAPTHYCPHHEWIILIAKMAFRLRDQGASTVGDVWRIPQESNTEHPAPFPVSLPARAIETTAPGPGFVLDPFCGSGSTLVAAKNAGRRAVGIEVSERYCEMAVRRLAQGSLFEASA